MGTNSRKQPIDVKLSDVGDKELEAVLKFRKAIKKPEEREAYVEGLYLIANSDAEYADKEKVLVEGTACALGIGKAELNSIVEAVDSDFTAALNRISGIGDKKFRENLFEEMAALTYLKGYQLSSEDKVMTDVADKFGISKSKAEKVQTNLYMQSQGICVSTKATWAKVALGAGGILAGAAICAVTAGAAAPAIGAAIGGMQGLTGIAAVNAGLATLGGGAIAAGGGGVAAGTAAVITAGAVAGGSVAAVGLSVKENINNAHDKKQLRAVIKKQQKNDMTKQQIVQNLIDAINVQKERLKKLEELHASGRDIQNLTIQIENLEAQKAELESEDAS